MSLMTGMSNCVHCHKLVANNAGTCPHCGEVAFLPKTTFGKLYILDEKEERVMANALKRSVKVEDILE